MKFDMSAAWQEAMAMISANRELLLIVTGIFIFLPAVMSGLALPNINDLLADPETMQAEIMSFYASYGWAFLLLLLVQMVGYLALLMLLGDRHRPTVGEAITTGVKGLLPAIGAMLLLMVGIFAASLAMALIIGLLGAVLGDAAGGIVGALIAIGIIVGFIYAGVKTSLMMPVVAIEKINNPLHILRRSWMLTRGNSVRLFLFYLLLMVAYLVIAVVIGLFTSVLALALGETAGLFVTAILSGVIGAIATMIGIAVLAAIHRQLSEPTPIDTNNSADTHNSVP